MEKIFSKTRVIEKALDAAAMRNNAIAGNIANVDTPGYKRKDVSFEAQLSEAIENRTLTDVNVPDEGVFSQYSFKPRYFQQNNLSETKPRLYSDNKYTSVKLDGNNVDIEAEMSAMAKNTIRYNTLAQSLSNAYRIIKTAISEGRK